MDVSCKLHYTLLSLFSRGGDRATSVVFLVIIIDPSIRTKLSQNLAAKLYLERAATATQLFQVSCASEVLNIEPFHAAGHCQ